MADDSAILKQLDTWKKKYYQSITDLEKQQGYDELLQRSLGRLALAAQGLDPALDKQLSSLRTILRKKNGAQHEIEYILDKMEKAIVKMEKTKVDENHQTTGEILSELLKSLKLSRAFKSEAKQLSEKLQKSSDKDVTILIPKLSSLFDNYLNQQANPKSSMGFGFNLFGLSKPNKTTKPILDEDKSTSLTDDDKAVEDKAEEVEPPMPTHLILMQLLEQVSLTPDLTKKTTKIRHRIQAGIEDQQLPTVIDDIAEIISALGTQVVAEKLEYEAFLKSLTLKLNQLDQYIRSSSDDDVKAFEERQTIAQSVETAMLDIREDVDSSGSIEQLKSNVCGTLDSLNQHFASYQKSDLEQFQHSQTQLRELKQRIHIMEQESIELRQTAMKSRDQALKDPLTGLWNRQALNEILEKEFTRWQRYKKPLTMVLWDIDLFKNINDIYGHAAGDKVLKTVARIFTSQTRDADFIARYGGEEFMGIFPETELADALRLANKIREKIMESKFHYDNTSVTITTSAGLACFKGADTIDDVFKRADDALYKAKGNGRNCCMLGDEILSP